MAGKSGRSINNVPKSPVKQMIFSWEGILVLLFIAVNIFCANFSEFYNLKSLLRQMPVYLAEIFLMLPMAYILVLGEIDISVGSIVCLSATMACIMANTGAPFIVVILATLLVGSLCGAVNAFVLTRFEELPPMIVTLATQIIFRGIAEIVLGSGGSISVTNTEGFAALGGKVGRVPYILFLVLILGIIEAVILGTMFFVVLLIGGFPYAATIGVMIGSFALIPYIGAFIGLLFGALLIATESIRQMLWFIIIFFVVQQIEGQVIYPRVVGGSVGLPALWTLFAVVVGGNISGIVGMIVFIPLFSVLYVLLRRNVYNRLKKKKISIEI